MATMALSSSCKDARKDIQLQTVGITHMELVDIDKGYIVARFYSADNYQKVLTRSLWTVMGHYLTITKWKSTVKPSDVEIHKM